MEARRGRSTPDRDDSDVGQLSHPAGADAHLRRCVLRGFHQPQTLPDANFIAGGLETPTTTKFVKGDIVYLEGTGYSAGAEYEIVRALRDINEYEMFPGQKKLLKETGQPYMEVGRVQVIDTRSKTAVAQIEYSCDPINPGDTAIPFAEKPMVPSMRRFASIAFCRRAARFPDAS